MIQNCNDNCLVLAVYGNCSGYVLIQEQKNIHIEVVNIVYSSYSVVLFRNDLGGRFFLLQYLSVNLPNVFLFSAPSCLPVYPLLKTTFWFNHSLPEDELSWVDWNEFCVQYLSPVSSAELFMCRTQSVNEPPKNIVWRDLHCIRQMKKIGVWNGSDNSFKARVSFRRRV